MRGANWYRSVDEREALEILDKASIVVNWVDVSIFGIVRTQVARCGDTEAAIMRLFQIGCLVDEFHNGSLQFRVFTDTPRGGKAPRDAA